MISKETVKELVLERFAEMGEGYYIVDMKISTANAIFVEIDNELNPISIDDCIRVSRNVEHSLDREVEDFELQVTSPGLTEPFKVIQQYRKNKGRDVKVKLSPQGKIEGKLVEVKEDMIIIETQEKKRIEGKKKKELVIENHEVLLENIKETKLIISF